MRNYRFTVRVVTGEDGSADILIKIPGTYNGFDSSVSSGRFFASAQIWAQDDIPDDLITDIQVEDLDEVLPAPLAAAFPFYPVLEYSIDPEMEFESGVVDGVRLRGRTAVEIGPLNTQLYSFIPSGLYLKAKIVSGNSAANRVFYVNITWVKK